MKAEVLKDSLRDEWQAMAAAWMVAMSSGHDDNRDGLLDGWMLDAIGEVKGLDVIDLGCGEGRFCRKLAERGAQVTGVDLCAPFIEFASAHRVGHDSYVCGDIENLSVFESACFDLAISYLSLVDVPDFAAVVREASRVLRPSGRFVICNLAPMVTAGNSWVKDENGQKLHFKLDHYFNETERMGHWRHYQWTNFHRTLATYINTFLEQGFQLTGLREPIPTTAQIQQYPNLDDGLRVPLFVIYLLQKQA